MKESKLSTAGQQLSAWPVRAAAQHRLLFWVLAAALTAVLAASLFMQHRLGRQAAQDMAAVQARALFDKELIYRKWNSSHGGVYVPVTEKTPPNPYLGSEVVRDVITVDGKWLTLINPIYMIRQVHALEQEELDVTSHITSLNPINPANRADEWETAALKRLAGGETEIFSLVKVDGRETLRLIRPLVAEESCLTCHAAQGCQLGDIRGGISVSVPLAPFYAAQSKQLVLGRLAHAGVWVLGLIFLAAGYMWLRRSEHSRSQAEELVHWLSRAVEQSPASVVITDADGRIEYVNPKFTAVTGYSYEEALGQNPRILKSGYQPPELYQDLWRTIASGREWRGEFLNKKKNGDLYWEFASISPLKDADGAVTHFLAVKEDITARKKAEEELRRQKDFNETIWNSISDAISIVDLPDCRIIDANQAFLNELGLSKSEVLGRTCYELTHQATEMCDGSTYSCPLKEMNKGRQPALVEHLHTDSSGTPKYAEIAVFPIKDDQGRITQVVHVSRDVTARKLFEQALQKAKTEAEAANVAKSQFLANISHEIRTPMNGIIGMTELALDTELTEEQREYLNLVKSSAESLLGLLNDLLDLSKIEAGKLDLEAIDFFLRDSLEEAVRLMAFRAQEKGLALNLYVDPEIPDALVGDPGRLRQVCLNLIGNAVKFTEQGEINVRVTLESKAEEELVLHFAVADTGIGIAPDKQKLIFEAFSQADGSISRQYGGTGLGLAITAQIVELFGGQIWVESDIGRGSAFHFTARFGWREEFEAKSASLDYARLRGLPVLVVDDNATARRILIEILNQWGLNPTAVEDGSAAMAAVEAAHAENSPFAMILLDSRMPDMDGFELARRLRASPALNDAPMIMLTSSAQRGDAARSREVGLTGYIPKPFKQSELWAVIKSALGETPPQELVFSDKIITRHSARSLVQGLRILVAEDNPVNQRLIERLLTKHGHSVRLAGDGREALEAWAGESFDLILMDIQMPVMNGLEAVEAIRKKEEALDRRIPIVALTAHALKGDREKLLEAGMDGYVIKPIRPEYLLKCVEGLALSPDRLSTACSVEELTDAEAEEVFDVAGALNWVGGDENLLREIAEIFLGSLPERLEEIRRAAAEGNARKLEASAHALKGSLGYFSEGPAFNAARTLVAMARAGDLTGAEDVFNQLRHSLDRTQAALADWLKKTD